MTQITKEAIEAALEAYAEGVYLTDEQVRASVIRIVEAALPFLPIAGEGIETATLKERLRAATVARKAAREALEKGFLNRIPDRVFDAVHEASSFPPNLDAADARSSTLEQKLKVATEALENIQQTRCDHDMGFDREIGPLGCSLGDKCVCVGLCTIASQALLETSALSAPSSPGKDGGQEVEGVAWRWTGSLGDERLKDPVEWSVSALCPETLPAGWRLEPLYARPQPASTALVERLTKALEPFCKHYEPWMERWDDQEASSTFSRHTFGDLREALAAINEARSALSASQSTSREGER